MITPNIYGKKNTGSKPPASITVVHGVYRPTYITIKLLSDYPVSKPTDTHEFCSHASYLAFALLEFPAPAQQVATVPSKGLRVVPYVL